jgi:heme exporter protein D
MFDFDAGKYAVYVWPAYAITALVIAAMVLDTLIRARRWRRAAEAGGVDGAGAP